MRAARLGTEFVEIYDNSGADHTVAGGGTGYALAASDGVARCVIPNGTVTPAGGHSLCANSIAYSLPSDPSGNGTTATADAAGSTSEANTLYKEGTGYPALVPFSIDYAWARDSCGKGGGEPPRPLPHLDPAGHGQQRRRLLLRGHQRDERRRWAAAGSARARESLLPGRGRRERLLQPGRPGLRPAFSAGTPRRACRSLPWPCRPSPLERCRGRSGPSRFPSRRAGSPFRRPGR